MKVFKFGGASVKDAAAFRNVSFLVQKHNVSGGLLVVVSAIGKTTNALETIFGKAYSRQDFTSDFSALKAYHFSVAHELFPDETNPVFAALENLFVQLQQALSELEPEKFDQQYDQLISFVGPDSCRRTRQRRDRLRLRWGLFLLRLAVGRLRLGLVVLSLL